MSSQTIGQKTNIFIECWSEDTTASLYAYGKLAPLVNQRNAIKQHSFCQLIWKIENI